jgi:hypothetical protein
MTLWAAMPLADDAVKIGKTYGVHGAQEDIQKRWSKCQ